MLKENVRQEMIAKRQSLAKADFWTLNDGILNEIMKIQWDDFNYVHLFLPIKENNEVDTFDILHYFKINYPDLQIVVPRTHFADLSMVNVAYDHYHTVLRKNSKNIPEPVYGQIVPVDFIDVILVPLLGFDNEGHRIGYGGGYYDKFLANCREDSLKIGLSLFDPTDKIADCHPYDIKLTHCITPTKTFQF